MGLGDIALIAGSLLGLFILFQPKLVRMPAWRATVTPLASIIGSGFLVSGPILAHTSGRWAWAAMLGLCVIGYVYGSVIRHNIMHIEPELADKKQGGMVVLERLSGLALVLAYFVSVAFYLTLFSAFALRIGDITDEFWIKALTSSVLAILGIAGSWKGLGALEQIEEYSVGLKLSVIGGLCLALLAVSLVDLSGGQFAWPELAHSRGWDEVRILLGLVILVQGFETSRYLGHAYPAALRVKTMRRAQWISTGIYIVFILLATRYFDGTLPESGGETAIIDLLRPVGFLVVPLLIAAAMASQLSAAVADMSGSGGLLSEVFSQKLNARVGYGLAAVAAILIVWWADIFQIITFASKAFLLYYGLQSAQAVLAIREGRSSAGTARGLIYAGAGAFAVLVIIFAIPAGV